jgi:hypothetical protein
MRLPILLGFAGLMLACSTNAGNAVDVLTGDQVAADLTPADLITDDAEGDAIIPDYTDAGRTPVPALVLPETPMAPQWLTEALPVATEGLAFDGNGWLYLSAADGRVLRVDSSGVAEEYAVLLPVDEGVNPGSAGLTIGPDGAIYVCRYNANRIEKVSGDPPQVEVFLETMDTPNTVLFRDDGTLWYTSSGGNVEYQGHVGRLRVGDSTPEIIVDGIVYANGLAFEPDESALYVTSTDPGSVLRVALDTDGIAGEPEVIIDGADMAIADGLLMASDGTLLIAGFGTGRLYAWRDGVLSVVAEDAGLGMFGIASLAWGAGAGFDEATIYATNLMKPVVYAFQLESTYDQ